MSKGDLLFVGLFAAYIFIGIIVLSAFYSDGDELDMDVADVCMILFWPIVVAGLLVFGICKIAWVIGKFFRSWI